MSFELDTSCVAYISLTDCSRVTVSFNVTHTVNPSEEQASEDPNEGDVSWFYYFKFARKIINQFWGKYRNSVWRIGVHFCTTLKSLRVT